MTIWHVYVNQFIYKIGVALRPLINIFLSELIIHDFIEARVLNSLQEPTPRKVVLLPHANCSSHSTHRCDSTLEAEI